jgi:ABC-type uncharacterized transport system substrate-binding protein
MKIPRRKFITLLGAAAAPLLAPRAARAQQSAMPLIGVLNARPRDDAPHFIAAFHQGLKELGFVEGQNLAVEYRYADGNYTRLPALAAELVARRPTVMVSFGGSAGVLAVKAATTTIPIVFNVGVDPVALGLAASMNRPGGNLTGVNILTSELEAKRLELLREVAPGASLIGYLINPAFPDSERQIREGETAARALGRRLAIANASTDAEIDTAYAALVQQRVGAMLVGSDPFLSTRRDRLVALAAQHALPAIYQWREFAAAGGLMSYGTNLVDPYRQAGVYVGRILKGEKPADLPIVQLAKVELVINMKTAKALGISFPLTLLGRADEVIE